MRGKPFAVLFALLVVGILTRAAGLLGESRSASHVFIKLEVEDFAGFRDDGFSPHPPFTTG